ncbi:MAG TPA: tetratricopeptide repeat protein [Actinophytocola sp.]|nr:tetratricopeptide repeat protein [Actinophytocola sp.]
MSGSAEDVVQARYIRGDVNFYGDRGGPSRPRRPPRQLPADVRDFVNRAGDLKHLDLILAEHDDGASSSAVCLIGGTAGVGKTSLAVHWAHRVADQFPDGQLYVDLHGYDPGPPVTAQQALDRFLRVLDVPPDSIPADPEARSAVYRSLLAGRRVLIVLDNAAGTAQVRPLLPGTAGCLVLVTSRSRLSGLMVRNGAYRIDLDVLTEPEAVELLRRVTDRFREPDSAGDLGELARLCARLPLALRIAAERAGSRPRIPLRDLIDELRDESALWDALTADYDDDSDAIRTVFAWSYRALSAEASRLFRLLGLHPRPQFSAAAAAALAGTGLGRVRRLLDDLVGAYLLEQVDTERYQFHDLLRAYAGDQVRAEEPAEHRTAAMRRGLRWYLHTADAALTMTIPQGGRVDVREPADVQPLTFTSYRTANEWYDREGANLVAAVRAAAAMEMYDIAWMLPAVLRHTYARRSQFDDWVETSTIGLDAARALGDRAAEAEMLASLGKAHVQSAKLADGIEFHQEAFRIRHELDDVAGMLDSANAIGLASLRGRRLPDAMAYFATAQELAAELGDVYWTGVLANNVANVHLELDEFGEAEQLLSGAVETFRGIEDTVCEGEALYGLSRARRGLGRPADALGAIRQALAIARENRYRPGEALWSIELGRVEAALGRPAAALEAHQRAAAMHRQIGDRAREASAFDATGEAYRELGRHDEAADFHRLAAAAFRELGDRWRLAVALANLGTALRAAGAAEGDAAAPLREAHAIVADFPDAHARAFGNSIARLMHRPHPV